MTFAVRIEKLSKRYRLASGPRCRYRTLRESVMKTLALPWQHLQHRLRGETQDQHHTEIWALKDVSFTITSGEVIGVIGRNGAGKSTLLKILSRITEPTSGRVELYGRVGSLLEVGTGFHPELSGRENIFLNGAILGMTRREIVRKFDEIVAFAEMDRFLDAPVKHYSSGMRMRLAFAVAAHFDPEILLMDEVLAVGDAAFQRKCLAKMRDVGNAGSTVLFVSHNLTAISRLCARAVWLQDSTVVGDGPAADVISDYLHNDLGASGERVWEGIKPGDNVARLCGLRVHTDDGQTANSLDIRRPILLTMEYDVHQHGLTLVPSFQVYNEDGVCVFMAMDQDPEWRCRPRPRGRYASSACVPGNFLAEGTFLVGGSLCTQEPFQLHFEERDAVAFRVIDSLEGDSARGNFTGMMPGAVRPMLQWQTRFSPHS